MDFETRIRALTAPYNEQYPRPWMSKLRDPTRATVFIVGRNQAKTFRVADVGSHDTFLDALFNRDGQSCRALYEKVSGKPSPTRRNIDLLTATLESAGCHHILETNVICYSTAMSADLRLPEHRLGAVKGAEIFAFLLNAIKPRLLIAHGSAVRNDLAKLLGAPIREAARHDDAMPSISEVKHADGTPFSVITLRSLAPPEWNRWSQWAPAHFQAVAKAAAMLHS